MKEARSSSETSVLTRATRRNIAEDNILHSHHLENLKSYLNKVDTKKTVGQAVSERVIALLVWQDSADKMYRDMYKKMTEEPDVLASSNNEGLKWVKDRNYAYFMESTSIQYITERDCDVAQVGELLDTKGYGIAMRKSTFH
jgi:hypothetical protein